MEKSLKRFIAILLNLTLMFGLMRDMKLAVYANGTNAYNDYLVTTDGNKDKSGDDLAALQVTFNGMQWYIIEDDSTALNAGTVTLLAKDTIGNCKFNENRRDGDHYSSSKIKVYMDGLTAEGGAFADVKDAITTIPSLKTLNFLQYELYDTAENVKIYLLSYQEANALPEEVRKCNDFWFLRSPGRVDSASFVREDGTTVHDGTYVSMSHGVRPALKLDLSAVAFSFDLKTFFMAGAVTTHSITITAADNMIKTEDSGAESQTVCDSIKNVIYEADYGYYFPEDYSITAVNGVTVNRNSYTQITVSGTLTADTLITLTSPTAKTIPDAPVSVTAINCKTTDNNDGKLIGVTTAMEYKKEHDAEWTDGTGSNITGLAPGKYYVRLKETDTAFASGNTELTISEFTVSFNGLSWYVIEDSSGTTDTGTVTLFAKNIIGSCVFGDNHYSKSQIKGFLDSLTAEGGAFEAVADAIVTIPSLTTKGYNSNEIYDTVENVKLYLLNVDEAYGIQQDIRADRRDWWLRSPGDRERYSAFTWKEGYVVSEGMDSLNDLGVRPALRLDLSKVIFSSESMTYLLRQDISSDDVTVFYGDRDKRIRGRVTSPKTGGGIISYAVKEGSEDYIDVDAVTGALTIRKVPADGKAYVIVTAEANSICAQATREVTVTIYKGNPAAANVNANNRTYDGTAKPLLTVTGEPAGGTMVYAVGTDATTAPTTGYTSSIPIATDIGTYYVWYKVIGDEFYTDSEPVCVKVTIEKINEDPVTEKQVKESETVKETINGVSVSVNLAVTYPKAVEWTGKKITRSQLEALQAEGESPVKLNISGLEEALKGKMKEGTDVSGLFSYSITISKDKDVDATAYFTVKVKLNSKAVKKAKIKGDDKKALTKLVKDLNAKLKETKFEFKIASLKLASAEQVSIKAKLKNGELQFDEQGELKGLKSVKIKIQIKGVKKAKTFTYSAKKAKAAFKINITDKAAKTAELTAIEGKGFSGSKSGITITK